MKKFISDVSLLDFEFLTMYDKNYNENTTFSELFRKFTIK